MRLTTSPSSAKWCACPWRASVLLCLPWIGACSATSTTVLLPEKPLPPTVAMQPCPERLPVLQEDLEQVWLIDPERVPREILENEIEQGRIYRECAHKHADLIQWVKEQ